jgi:hypothetical protein
MSVINKEITMGELKQGQMFKKITNSDNQYKTYIVVSVNGFVIKYADMEKKDKTFIGLNDLKIILVSEVEDSASIKKVRDVLENGYKEIGGVLIDSFTASAIICVYDKLNDSNKEKFGNKSIVRMAEIAWKFVK